MTTKRAEILELVKKNIHHVSNKKSVVSDIKDELSKYRITEGRIEEVMNSPDELEKDLRELALFTEQIYLKTGIKELNPENLFTKAEMKEARSFDYISENSEDEIMLPLTLKVLPGHDGGYMAIEGYQLVAKLMKSQKVLSYDFAIQRQGTKIKRKDEMILVPTIDKKNVREIKDLLIKGDLKRTTITLNAATLTSDSGEELIYNPKTGMLTITEGTKLNILDGYHRCLASQEAYEMNQDLNIYFNLNITNYSTRQAQEWQAETAKGTPLTKGRIQEMEASRFSDLVVQNLKAESELRGRVSSDKGKINITAGDLVSYTVLSDAIDREFPMKARLETRGVSDHLALFFEYLFGTYPTEFGDSKDRDKNSLMSYNKMFAGYIALAAKMKNENIEIKNLKSILDKVDFSRNNKTWKDVGVTDSEGKISGSSDEKKIGRFFKELKI